MAKAKTRTVTRYVTKKKRRRAGSKISIAIVAGLIPGMAFSLSPGIKNGDWNATAVRMASAYTGYNSEAKKWAWYYMKDGALPLLLGVMAHKIAGRIGLNRAIAGSLGKWIPVNI